MIRRAFLGLVLACRPEWHGAGLFTAKPIVNAVREGDEEKVRQALLKGESANQIDTSGRPLLMVAVMAGQIAVVETLLKGGAGVDATDGRAIRRCSRPPSAAMSSWSTYC